MRLSNKILRNSTANKYYFSAGHHEQKNKKNYPSNQIFGGHKKATHKTSLTTFSM